MSFRCRACGGGLQIRITELIVRQVDSETGEVGRKLWTAQTMQVVQCANDADHFTGYIYDKGEVKPWTEELLLEEAKERR
ncbi:MAG: hypothetical protein AB1442_16850 [Nitrospirota bacterium]